MSDELSDGGVGASAVATSNHDVLNRLLMERYSCRAFLPVSVADEVIVKILSSAQRSASWCNTQPWQTIVTRGGGTDRLRSALLDAAASLEPRSDIREPSEYHGVYLQRRRETGFGMYSSLGIERGDMPARQRQQMENFRLFGAPHVAIVTCDARLGPYGLVDTGAYVASFLLAAQSLGVATVAQAAIAMYSDVVHEFFAIPQDRLVVCGISFGYPDEGHAVNAFRTSRADLDAVVTWVDQ